MKTLLITAEDTGDQVKWRRKIHVADLASDLQTLQYSHTVVCAKSGLWHISRHSYISREQLFEVCIRIYHTQR